MEILLLWWAVEGETLIRGEKVSKIYENGEKKLKKLQRPWID